MLASLLQAEYGDKPAEWFDAEPPVRLHVAGRMMFQRIMGKASFAKLQDRTGQIQIFLQRDTLGEAYEAFKKYDVGDILAATGTLFKTKTGELSVRVEELRMLVKSLRPLPDKWHGMADVDTRYRQRYVDLIVNEQSRQTSSSRAPASSGTCATSSTRWISSKSRRRCCRRFRAAPRRGRSRRITTRSTWTCTCASRRSCILKRLIVGGLERVYEINRNFRNEGVSTRHNPEFTMLELYVAYADYNDLIVMVERAMQGLADVILGKRQFDYQGRAYDLDKPFRRISVIEAVAENVGRLRPGPGARRRLSTRALHEGGHCRSSLATERASCRSSCSRSSPKTRSWIRPSCTRIPRR